MLGAKRRKRGRGSTGRPASGTADGPPSVPLPIVHPVEATGSILSVTFDPDIEVIEIVGDDVDEYTFDNFRPDGSPKVSQTRVPRKNKGGHGRKYCPPANAVWAHYKAVRLATDGAVFGLPPPGEVGYQGRRSYVFPGQPEDEVYDVPFAADISVKDGYDEFVSFAPMAYWSEDAVWYMDHHPKRNDWSVHFQPAEKGVAVLKDRWSEYCHVGDVPYRSDEPASRTVAMAWARRDVTWTIDSGAGVHIMSDADCKKARLCRRPCPPLPISGVGSSLVCNQMVDLRLPELGFDLEVRITPADNAHNLLSVDLLCSESGCSFVQMGHLGLPPFLITPDGLHAVVLKIEGNVPVYRQDLDEFPVEELVS